MKITTATKKAAKRFAHSVFVYNCLKLLPGAKSKLNAGDAMALLQKNSQRPASSSYTYNNIFEPEYDLTIVVPAYNVEKYIEQCLNSILSQKTRYSFYIIVVNDGSTDSTSEILNKYKAFPHIEIIYQNNKGFSGARNAGIKNVNSRYLMFVDSDDILEKDAVEILLSTAFEFDADIVEGGHYRFSIPEKLFNTVKTMEYRHENKNLISPLGTMLGYAWGKVFRALLFQNIQFPEGYWFEDTIIAYLLYPLCKQTVTVEAIVYGYREHPESISANAWKLAKCLDTYYIMELMFEDMRLLGIDKNQLIYEQTLSQIHLNYYRTRAMPCKVRESIFVLSASLIKREFPNYRTTIIEKKELEESLLNNNYRLYNCLLDY